MALLDKSPLVVCISGPSGVGKGSVLEEVLKHEDKSWISISTTSRPLRKGEVEGEDYYFVSEEDFCQMVEADQLLEYDRFCGNYYGTPRAQIEDRLAKGYNVFLDITVKGALAIKKAMPQAITIFLAAPDKHELRSRLEARGTEAPETINKRLAQAPGEIGQGLQFDYFLINETLEETSSTVEDILYAERLRAFRRAATIGEVLKKF